jgi:hypothetical protein
VKAVQVLNKVHEAAELASASKKVAEVAHAVEVAAHTAEAAKAAKEVERAGKSGVEIVERAMSKAELKATKETGLLRGGREGTHYASDAVNHGAKKARQRLSLGHTPEVRVKLEVPSGEFSEGSRVKPDFGMPGGGMERTANGPIPAKVISVHEY